MDTCSRFRCYDYPWQATIPKAMIIFKYELQALTNLTVASNQHASKKLTDEAKFLIFIISIFLILTAIGTTFTVYDNYVKKLKKRRRSSDGEVDTKNVYSYSKKTSIEKWFKKLKELSQCFCILTNGTGLLTPFERELLWLNGIRFIGCIWIIAMHGTLFYSSILSSWDGFKPWIEAWFMPLLLNGTCIISLFFVLSGFFNGYFTSRTYFKSGRMPSWLRFYWKRILRIAPLYVMILGFYAILSSYVSSGALAPPFGTNPVCKESWWRNLFFINNFQTAWEQCYVPSWYVAADLQLHLISPLFLILLLKWPRFGYSFIVLTICASCCYRCIMTIKYELFYHLSSFPYYLDESDMDSFSYGTWIYIDTLYTQPFPNLGAYLIGLGLGHYLWNRETSKQRRNNTLILCCGWIGFAICMWICFDVLYFSEETLLKRVSYNGFSDFLFSCGIAWIIYVCATKQGGFVSRLLSLKIFVPLSRLSYGAYLINCIVLLNYSYSATKQETFSFLSLLGAVFDSTFWTYLMSLITCLIFGAPMGRILRLFHYI